MAIKRAKYYAICIYDSGKNEFLGKKGVLYVYESEHKYPGKPFILFVSENGNALQTSPGYIFFDNTVITFVSQQENKYKFRILNQSEIMAMLEKC